MRSPESSACGRRASPSGRAATVASLAALCLLVLAAPAAAQTGSIPTGLQEYFVVGHEEHIWDMMDAVDAGEGPLGLTSGMNSVVSFTASADDQRVYYDQWEDGLEADPMSPTQATTLVFGDGVAANGRACDYTSDPRVLPCGGASEDTLFQGTSLNLNSDQGLVSDGCAAGLRCSIATPRNPAEMRFDGGDRLMTSGGPLSLIHTQAPQDPYFSPHIGGSVEIFSRQAVADAFSYTIPVGEDSYGGDGSRTEPFKYVWVDLVAFDDGTSITINNGATTLSFTLDRGQHYSSLGSIDPAGPAVAGIPILAGTRISTSGPIAATLFTAGDGTYANRFYALQPDRLHSTDYVIAAPGDTAGVPGGTAGRPLNLYIFNPDPLNSIAVTATDAVGTRTFNIAPNSMVNYYDGAAPNRYVPAGSTVRLTSDRNFWGVTAYDHQGSASDWGDSFLATRFLTTSYTVAYAPGGPGTSNYNPLFVSPVVDGTLVQIDLNNDGVYDQVDTNGDGAADAFTGPGNSYVVNALQSLRIYDYTDRDNSGTTLVASAPVAISYGQDTDVATDAGGSDTGYTVIPGEQRFLDPVLTLDKDVSPTYVVPTSGGTVTYTLTVRSYQFGPLTNLTVADLLPAGVPGTAYVAGSTLITYPDFTQSSADPTATLDASGRWRLTWALTPDTIGLNQTLTVRYRVAIPAGPVARLQNNARAQGQLGSSRFTPTAWAYVTRTDVALTKTGADDGAPEAGDVLTYSVTVRNNGITPETGVVITDSIPAWTTFVAGSITNAGPFVGTYSAAQNAVVWTAASFAAGTGPFTLTFQVRIDPTALAGSVITNAARYRSVATPGLVSEPVHTVVVGPILTSTKSATPATVLHPDEIVTFEVLVANSGSGAATTLLIRDPLPANATYVTGSMSWSLNGGSYVALTDAADADEGTLYADRLELVLASLGAGQDVRFRFEARVNAGTAGQFVANQATVAATQVTPQDTNLVQVPIVGTATITGHVFIDVDGDGTQDAGEPDLPNVSVLVTDSTGVTQRPATDANGDYTCTVDVSCYADSFESIAYGGSDGQLDWSAAPWIEFPAGTDPPADQNAATAPLAVVADPLGVNGYSLRMSEHTVPPDEGFQRAANLGGATTAYLVFNYRRVSMDAGVDRVTLEASYNGGAFVAIPGGVYNGTGVDDPAWLSASFTLTPGVAMNDVVIRFRSSLGFATGFGNDYFYIDNVGLCPGTTATLDVDETDPDMPPGAALTTGNDPQTVATVPGGSVASSPVGYEPPPLTVAKTSDAGGTVVPGQVVTYTVTVTNNTGVAQTGITVSDPLPAGTTYVPGSAQVNVPVGDAFRVTEYYIDNAGPDQCTEGGTDFAAGNGTCTLTLNQNLAPDYFVIIQGSDNDTGGDSEPDDDYVALTGAPAGTPGVGADLTPSGAANRIVLSRGDTNDDNAWIGVVTVVECIGDCTTNGFTLLDAQRVAHAGLSGTDTSATAWADISRVMLMGGVNGAGCTTGDFASTDHESCHVRLTPSGTNTITWSRGGEGGLEAATSTVMVLQWGSAWTVQRTAITNGDNGGDEINVAGEYNTAGINPVTRARTWVWGTGHTSFDEAGESAEGVALALGGGVTQNATESLIAAGINYPAMNVNFDVYALAHPNLRVDHDFVLDGNTGTGGAQTVGVTTDSATANRMALVTNSLDDNGGGDYPRSILSARYTTDTNIQLERRRSNADFAAWVQGINFDAIPDYELVAAGDPPNLLAGDETLPSGSPLTLPSGTSMTITYQVTVDNPLDPAITEITNTASVATAQEPTPVEAAVTDLVVRPGVMVEPDNAGFAYAGNQVTYTHDVTNTGNRSESFLLTVTSENGWVVELVDPTTGGVIARDSNGDGAWDGGVTVNTGTLAPGATRRYRVRVTVPVGASVGTQDTVQLVARANGAPQFQEQATDETTVLGAGAAPSVDLVPDNAGVVTAGSSVVYPHRVYNNTGAADTFDLQVASEHSGDPTWSIQIYGDTNGDGVYTAGTDLVIANTAQIPDGGSQLFFVAVVVPAGTTPWTVDVAHLTATSRSDTTLLDGATDTTTVVPQGWHDLSGGGTRLVLPGNSGIFPGTLRNFGIAADTFSLSITESSLNGLDPATHGTELWIDTTGDGVPDTRVAADTNGDGTWNFIAAGYGTAAPELTVPGGGELAYELRRPVDLTQGIYREHVTVSTLSLTSAEEDNITATVILAAVTRASVRGLRVDRAGRIELAVGFQHRTRSFDFYATDDARGRRGRRLLNERPVMAARADSLAPLTYRVETGPIAERYLVVVETEVDGQLRTLGPFEIGDRRLAAAFARVDARLEAAGAGETAEGTAAPSRLVRLLSPTARRQRAAERAAAALHPVPRPPTSGVAVKIATSRRGQMTVPLARLGAVATRTRDPRRLVVTNLGRRVPHVVVAGPEGPALSFPVEALSTDYSGDNVYVISTAAVTGPSVTLTISGDAPAAGATRIEKGVGWVVDAPDGWDPWVWDELFSDSGTWPYPDSAPGIGGFDLGDMAPGATGDVPVRLRLYFASAHEHAVDATLNGWPLGRVTFEGRGTPAEPSAFTIPASLLFTTGNELTLSYAATPLAGTDPDEPGHLYLDYLELDVPRTRPALAPAAVGAWRADLPVFRGVQYLIVTHPLFRAAADRLASAKRAQGLTTAVIDVDRAYDRFSGGIPEGRAIQALIRYAAKSSGRMSFVLLLGDDTFDARDFLGTGARSYVPSLWTWDSGFGRIPSENLYADLDGDAKPELAIGRLPVGTIEQADALVDKIAAQTTLLSAHAGRHLAAIDNDNDEDAPFADEAVEMSGRLPATTRTTWADLRQGAAPARATLEAAWRSGTAVTSYFGHGGPEVWADEQLVTIDDVDRLGDAIRPTVVLDWACQSQWYTYLWGDTVNEALLRVPGGGAVASFGPVGITPPASQRLVYEALYPELGSGETLGEMIRRAKRAAIETQPGAREAVEGFALLGDPALRLPPPLAAPE